MRPLARRTVPHRVKENRSDIRREQRKPDLPDRWVYVETGDDQLDTFDSPEWLNGFTFVVGSPVAYRHGLDGQGDMIGMYDLITGGPVSGDVAFVMPLQWARTMPDAHMFPIELEMDVWSIAIQTVNHLNGNVRIFWPIVATPYP